MVYYLDGIDITDYVLTEYSIGENKSFVGDDLVRLPQFQLEIWNIEDAFNPFNPASLFYGRDSYETEIAIWQDKRKIYSGLVKTIDVQNYRCRMTVTPDLNQIIDRTAIYITEDKTPAYAFKDLLTINGLLDYVDLYTYYLSDNIQSDWGLLVDINFYINNSATILSVIKQLAEIAGCDVYFSNNLIHFQQHIELDESLECDLTIPYSAIVSDIEVFNDTDNIRNQYSYETDAITLQDYVIGIDSRKKWGERSYSSINLQSTSEISCSNTVALTNAGENKILKALNPKKYCRFTVNTQEFDYPFDLLTIFQFHPSVKNGIYENQLWAVYEVNWSNQQAQVVALNI